MKKNIRILFTAVFTCLALSIFTSASSTKTVLTRTSGKIKCEISLEDIEKGSVIVVTSFKNGRVDASQFKNVTSNSKETFYVDNNTKEIRVFVFESITSITPVTEGEFIEVKLDSITDPDWSEWV